MFELQLHFAFFRNAAKDVKKEMNESNLKFCLNALIQLLYEWGGNYISWEKIFDDETDDDENVEIDFGKSAFYKNECDEMNDFDIEVNQDEKRYVFNTIFEIIETEGTKKIFKYTFSEAVRIMRSSEIILIKKQIY
jgi:hypothetical protein